MAISAHFGDLGPVGSAHFSDLGPVTLPQKSRGHLDHFRPKSPKWAKVTWSEMVVGRDRQYPREAPLSIYLVLKWHALTRSRGLVEKLFILGLCVPYDRLLQMTADMANSVLERFQLEQVVCTSKFPVFNMCNPSSSTAYPVNTIHRPNVG